MDFKTCITCTLEKAKTSFYKDKTKRDGFKNKCKDCELKTCHAYRKTEMYRTNTLDYQRSERGKLRNKNRVDNKRRSGKQKAHDLLRSSIRNGSIKRKPCEICNSNVSHGHHDDYSKPLEVVWLCPLHHMERHVHLKASA